MQAESCNTIVVRVPSSVSELPLQAAAFQVSLAAALARPQDLRTRRGKVGLALTAASVAGGAAWKLFHSTSGARWFFIGGLGVGCFVLFVK